MKKFGVVLLVCCLLFVGCSNVQESTVVFDADETFIRGSLVSDGAFVWMAVNDASDFDGPAEVVKLDGLTGEVVWHEQYGVAPSNGLVLGDSVLWAFAQEPVPEIGIKGETLVQVDPGTGGVVGQRALPSFTFESVVVGETAWILGTGPTDVYIHDEETLELVDTIETSKIRPPEGSPIERIERLSKITLFGDTMWFSDGRVMFSIDLETHEVVDSINPNNVSLDVLEVHDGLLWVGDTDTPGEGTFSYDPETGEMVTSELYASPIGNVYHDGFIFDVIDATTVAQVDAETGEQVATFPNLDPFSVVVTDGYLWAHDGREVSRYETKS